MGVGRAGGCPCSQACSGLYVLDKPYLLIQITSMPQALQITNVDFERVPANREKLHCELVCVTTNEESNV